MHLPKPGLKNVLNFHLLIVTTRWITCELISLFNRQFHRCFYCIILIKESYTCMYLKYFTWLNIVQCSLPVINVLSLWIVYTSILMWLWFFSEHGIFPHCHIYHNYLWGNENKIPKIFPSKIKFISKWTFSNYIIHINLIKTRACVLLG